MPRTPPGVRSNSASVRVTTQGHIEIDMKAIMAAVGVATVGHIVERVDKGLDVNDQPFAQYSDDYREWLKVGGENPDAVDLRLTGGLMNSVKVRETRIENGTGFVTVGPGTGTSAEVTHGGRTAFQAFTGAAPKQELTKTGKPKKPRASSHTNKRSPPHNILGSYLQKKRPWLGVSPLGMAKLRQLIERVMLKGGA